MKLLRLMLQVGMVTMILSCGDKTEAPTGIIGTWARSSTREYQCSNPSYDQPENPTCLGGGPCPTYVFTATGFTYTNPNNGDSRSGTYSLSGDHLTLTDQNGTVVHRVALTSNTLSFLTTEDYPLYVCTLETKYTRK